MPPVKQTVWPSVSESLVKQTAATKQRQEEGAQAR